MVDANTTFDYLIFFFWAARLELLVMAFGVVIGTCWSRDNDLFRLKPLLHILPSMPSS
jgi:hypothetical protein